MAWLEKPDGESGEGVARTGCAPPVSPVSAEAPDDDGGNGDGWFNAFPLDAASRLGMTQDGPA